jgi:hypothetical protein
MTYLRTVAADVAAGLSRRIHQNATRTRPSTEETPIYLPPSTEEIPLYLFPPLTGGTQGG